MTLAPGTRLGQYEIEAPLGAGGMGEVYRAKDTRLARSVAIKVLPAAMASDPQALARFEREAQAVAALSHPNILALHDFSTEDAVAYAVMELLDGETLRARLAAGALPVRKAIEYATQIARGLAAAHERGIVHRDLKPENLFVTKDEQVKILDFGLAKRAPSPEAETMAFDRETAPGTVLGTVGYMSPEQVRGEQADARGDLFAFGAILYEMLSGRRAFRGDSAVETMSAILKEEPEELRATGRELPPALERIVRHCLEKRPEVRFQSARDLAFDLESIAEQSGTGTLQAMSGRGAGRRRRVAVLAGLATAIVLATAAGWWIGRRSAGSARGIAYENLTYRRGAVTAARFAPDGQTFVYSAAWDGRPVDLYAGRIGSPDSRSLGLSGSSLLSVSSKGELAVSLGWHYTVGLESLGTLATVPLEGGAPRALLEDVHSADWGPEGSELAVSHVVGGECRLEFPIGTVLYKNEGWISDVRVGPNGREVAFVDHSDRGESFGVLTTVDLHGQVTRLGQQTSIQGLGWSPDGNELWTASETGEVKAIDLRGNDRQLLAQPSWTTLADIGHEGRLLLISSTVRREIGFRKVGSSEERNLGWYNWSFPEDLSADGRTLLFEEHLLGLKNGYAIFVRPTDGSPPVRIGEGKGFSLAPDGRWVLTEQDPFGERPELALVPIGAGQPRLLPDDGVRYQAWGRFVPDGSRVLLLGNRKGETMQLFERRADGAGETRQISRKGIRVTFFGIPISPDGGRVVYLEADGRMTIRSLASDSEIPVAGVVSGEEPAGWTPDGRSILVCDPKSMPLRIDRLDPATGARAPWTAVQPADPTGVFRVGPVQMSADNQSMTYSFIRFSDTLYLATGAR